MPCAHLSRLPRPASITVAVSFLVVLLAATPAWAWGRLGHRVISRLAERHLTPQAKAAIAELLVPGESLADASLWADEYRGRLPKTAPWHYVDVPLDEPRYDAGFSGDVSTKGCVVAKINEFRLAVRDKSKSIEDRRLPCGSSSIGPRICTSPATLATITTRAATGPMSVGSTGEATRCDLRLMEKSIESPFG